MYQAQNPCAQRSCRLPCRRDHPLDISSDASPSGRRSLQPPVNAEVGRLVPVDLREVWRNEAADFTPWLLENADVLADALGLDLELTASEHPVGPFSLDLSGRDLTNDSILVIENQLGQTDHGHLGQLLTYAANTDAATIVWIAPAFREEHRQALAYLNELGGERARFFGVEVAAVRIGDSLPAPPLRVIAQPNETHAQVSEAARVSSADVSGKGALYASFWDRLLGELRTRHRDWTRSTKGPAQNWITLPSPLRGMTSYSMNFPSQRRLRCELYLDASDADSVQQLYSSLEKHRQEIDAAFGEPLSWEPNVGRRASRIAAYGTGDITETSHHDEYVEWFIQTMERLRSAIDARVGTKGEAYLRL